jgi:hypothetical protein
MRGPAEGPELLKKRLTRHLDQGIYFENMGLSRSTMHSEFAACCIVRQQVAREHLGSSKGARLRNRLRRAIDPTITRW